MLVNETGARRLPTRRDDDVAEMILDEFDAPRTWMPAGELSFITAAVFLLVAVIAWLR